MGLVVLSFLFVHTDATDAGKSSVARNMESIEPKIELDGEVLGYFSDPGEEPADVDLMQVFFCIKLSNASDPVNMGLLQVPITYRTVRGEALIFDPDGRVVKMLVVEGDEDMILEKGERFEVIIDLREIDGERMTPPQEEVYPHPLEPFIITLHPPGCPIFEIERVVPTVNSTVTRIA